MLRAALAGPEWPAVLLLLWTPKHFRPADGAPTTLQEVQANLGALGAHYQLPTLHMQRAFAAPCAGYAPGADPTPAGWCYRRNGSRHGEEGMLHGDMYHPNNDGHAFFAAHILELLERAALLARAAADAPAPRGPLRLPAARHALNSGLGSDGGGAGGRAGTDGEASNCLDVEAMASSASVNRGWAVVEEANSAGVKRLPALQATAANATIAWTVDLRGVAWMAVTYMQSYAGFAAADVVCANGCECLLHGGTQESADVDAAAPEQLAAATPGGGGSGGGDGGARNRINATSGRTRTSEPQWRIFDVRATGEGAGAGACELRVRTVSPGKFKLMLISLIRVAPASDPAAAELVRQSTTGSVGRAALACFGVHDAASHHGHGMVAVSDRISLDTLALDDSRYWTRRGYKAVPLTSALR